VAKRIVLAIVSAVLATGVFVASGSAAAPTFERVTIDESFPDEFLTEACGVSVTTQATGHITIRTFAGEGTGPVAVTSINIALTAMAGDNSYRFRDVGADVIRISPDGTEILMVVGQIPFGFTGALKVNLTTDEVILEPQHITEGEVEEACAALTA
jgi:hypothetical protein